MKIIVCDDEPMARERLVRMVGEVGHEVVAATSSSEETIQAVKEHMPDVVLMDVRMPNQDGIRCAHLIKELPSSPAIIFVTAYDHYAIAAFKAQAIGYLLKPAGKEELIEALSNAKQVNNAQLNHLRKLDNPDVKPARQHIAARTHRGVELIPVTDIYYFLADQKYVNVRHKDGTVLIDETLKELEEEFGNQFFRIHRNALLSLSYLEALESIEGGQYQVAIKGVDDKLSVSRRHLPALREKVQNM